MERWGSSGGNSPKPAAPEFAQAIESNSHQGEYYVHCDQCQTSEGNYPKREAWSRAEAHDMHMHPLMAMKKWPLPDTTRYRLGLI